jgi:RNA polymerase sigma factor (sigma-70 family)
MKMQAMDTQNDAELLTEFAVKGKHAAFATLVNRHGPMALGIAMRVLSNHHDAQDVTQAVFILLARDAKKLASSPSVAGWIHTVTRRLALNAHDSRARRQRREQTAMEHASTTTTLNLTQVASCRRELDAAIARLPERYRQPLLLVHFEGTPMDEVAKRLSLHPDTLRTRLSRACGKLRELLGQRGVEIASVTVLSSFLTNELKASSAFSPELSSTVINGAIGGASVSPHVLALSTKGAISTSLSLSAIAIFLKTKATILIATFVTLSAIASTMLHFNKNSESTTSLESNTPAPAFGSARTTQSFASTGITSQGKRSQNNAEFSSADDPFVQAPLTTIKRIMKTRREPIIKGNLPGNLTWSKDSLTLLGLDEGQQARLQESLDQASARALEVIKRKVKPLSENTEIKHGRNGLRDNQGKIINMEKDGRHFEITDWSREEGHALRAEMKKALESVVSGNDAAFLMNLLSDKTDYSGKLVDEAAQSLFGEGYRKLTFVVVDGEWIIVDNLKDSGPDSSGNSDSMKELPKEWLELFNLSNPSN